MGSQRQARLAGDRLSIASRPTRSARRLVLETLEQRRLLAVDPLVGGRMAVAAAQDNVAAAAFPSGLIGEYTFENVLPLPAPNPDALDRVPNSALGGPASDLVRRIRAASYDDAESQGSSAIGSRLGNAGRIIEPASGNEQFGFWLPRSMLTVAPSWSTLFWVNRADLDNLDIPFYVGTSDGFGGSGAETYILMNQDGLVSAHNYNGSGTLDADIVGSAPLSALDWHQIGLTFDGTSLALYLDGQLAGNDNAVSLGSLTASGNSVIVFGGIKTSSASSQRTRMLDGLLDQIEIYDRALLPGEVQGRYEAFAVPDPLLAISNFDDGTLQGWTKAEPFGGDLVVENTGGQPGGKLVSYDTSPGGGGLYAQAPTTYLGDLSGFAGVRWDEFLVNHGSHTISPTTVALRGGPNDTGYLFDSSLGPIGAWNERFVSFDAPGWRQASLFGSTGTDALADVLKNVTALYIAMDASNIATGNAEAAVDNVRLVRSAPPIAYSDFTTDLDGWTGQGTGVFSHSTTGGNPGGYARFLDNSGGGDTGWLAAPAKFLGDWSALDYGGVLAWHHRVVNAGGSPTLGNLQVRISGPGGQATYTGPLAQTAWSTITVPIDRNQWTLDSGGWDALLLNVASLQVTIEGVLNQASPGDTDGVDNVRLYLPAVPNAHPGGPYTVREGANLVLDASQSQSLSVGPLAYSWDVNGDGIFGDAVGVNPALTWPQLTALGFTGAPTSRSIRVRATDALGISGRSVAAPLTVLGRHIAASSIENQNVRSLNSAAAGTGATAGLSSPIGAVYDSIGNLYVSEFLGQRVSKIAPDGTKTVFAGVAQGVQTPTGLAIDAADNLYVANYLVDNIVKISPAGASTVLASAADGLTRPFDLAVDSLGNVFAVGIEAHTVWKIAAPHSVSVFGDATDGLFAPLSVAVDASNRVYVGDFLVGGIRRFTATHADTVFVPAGAVPAVTDLAFDPVTGQLYVAQYLGANRLSQVTPAGVVTTFAGAAQGVSLPFGVAVGYVPPAGAALAGFEDNASAAKTPAVAASPPASLAASSAATHDAAIESLYGRPAARRWRAALRQR